MRLNDLDLQDSQRIELLRLYELTFYRMGPPDEETRKRVILQIEDALPSARREINSLSVELLCYVQSPNVAGIGLKLLSRAPTQEEQLDYARSLRFLKSGWSDDRRRQFFGWISRAHDYKGGQNFEKIIEEIQAEALIGLSDEQLATVKELLEATTADQPSAVATKQRAFVKDWTRDDLLPLLEGDLRARNFDLGREMFAAANCFACHRFNEEGGAAGPDLTALSGRFTSRDILESVLEPSKVISDQFAAVTISTKEGRVITGRIVNYNDGEMHINTNMLDPLAIEKCNQSSVDELEKSDVSMMPQGLLNTLSKEEILVLFAYLLSRGDPNHAAFAESATGGYSSSPAN